MMLQAKGTSPLCAGSLVRYLILCAACRKRCNGIKDPDGEFLE